MYRLTKRLVVVALVLLPMSLQADVVGINGTITSVPGYSGATLNYRVGAVKTGDSAGKTAHAWFKLTNPNSFEIKVVLCAMLTLHNKSHITVPRTVVTKNNANEWQCGTSGTSFQPPNFHFSCRRVTIPAGGTIDALDQAIAFSVPFAAGDLGAIYFDVLKDCPLKNCDIAKGPDQWVVPLHPAQHPDWVNIWASGKPYHDLQAGGFSEASWPSGNWVTMGFPDLYPARLTGTVTGALAGSVVELIVNGVPTRSYVVEPDPEAPACRGRDLRVEAEMTISGEAGLPDGVTLAVPRSIDQVPEQCGVEPEGAVVRFNGEVTAREGAPFYRPGEFMYGVDVFFVKDTEPPLVQSVGVSQRSERLRVDVAATDDTTMAMGATFVYTTDGELHTELPIGYADPASLGDTMLFVQEFSGLPLGVPITYHVDVYDEVGNRASTAPQTLVLLPPPTASHSILWPPNHKMVDVTVDYTVPGGGTCALSVTSDEPVNGFGDGNTAPDWEIVDARHVRLRAERSGRGTGRVYTIAITCTDSLGHNYFQAIGIKVPLNRRGRL